MRVVARRGRDSGESERMDALRAGKRIVLWLWLIMSQRFDV